MNTKNRRQFLFDSTKQLVFLLSFVSKPGFAVSTYPRLLAGFTWIAQSAFRIESNGLVIYFDPYKVPATSQDADFVFVSHQHSDHCNPTEIKKILKNNTQIVTEPSSADKIRSLSTEITILAPGENRSLGPISVIAVPAYNIDKTNHPKSNNWLGFIVTLPDGRKVYHAGDTDRIPEMKTLQTDIALLPCGGTYTMNISEAASAALDIQTKIAVPMHYGSVVGNKTDGLAFQRELQGKLDTFVFTEGQSIPPVAASTRNWRRLR